MKQTLFMIAVAMITACAAPAPDTTESPSNGPATPAVTQTTVAAPNPLPQRCTNAQYGISISYPDGWHTNDGSVLPACSVFDPMRFEIPRQSELPFDIAVVLHVETGPVDQLTRSSQFERVLSATPVTIGGRTGSRVEVEATGEGLADRGLRSLRYVVNLGGGRSLVASTHATDDYYEQKKEILRRMVESVTLD